MTFLPSDLLAEFESEPAFPDRDSWYWKWVVLTVGCALVFIVSGALLLAHTVEQPRKKRRIF